MVEVKRRDYGYDPDYSDEFEWVYGDECVAVEPDVAAGLEERYQNGDEQDTDIDYRRVIYQDRWEFVQAFLTAEAADQYRLSNHYRHSGDLWVFVDSGYRNPEWIKLRAALMALAEIE